MHGGMRFCCYCHLRQKDGEMTPAPRKAEKLQEWREILGENFYRNTLRYVAPYICRSHFEYQKNRLRRRGELPIAMNEVAYAEAMRERPVEIGEETEDVEEPSESNQSICCCYCGNEDSLQNMTNVPQIPSKLKIWVQILGRQFYQNTLGLKRAYICRAHFPGLGINSYISTNAIPMAMKNGEHLKIEMIENLKKDDEDMPEVDSEDQEELPTTSNFQPEQQLDPNTIQCSLEFIIPYVTRCFECKSTAEFLVTRVDFGAVIECNCKSCRNSWTWKSSSEIALVEEKPEEEQQVEKYTTRKLVLRTVRE